MYVFACTLTCQQKINLYWTRKFNTDRLWFHPINVQSSEYVWGLILNKYLKIFNSVKYQLFEYNLQFTIYNIKSDCLVLSCVRSIFSFITKCYIVHRENQFGNLQWVNSKDRRTLSDFMILMSHRLRVGWLVSYKLGCDYEVLWLGRVMVTLLRGIVSFEILVTLLHLHSTSKRTL